MPNNRRPAQKTSATFLILAGLALLLIAIFVLKRSTDSSASAVSLESQLDQALAAKRPTVVFLHSLNCIPCKTMMKTVADVYPDYQDSVLLIDVDISDQRNSDIIQRERLQSIPTVVFYDVRGIRQVFIGAMPSEQFRGTLDQLAAGQ